LPVLVVVVVGCDWGGVGLFERAVFFPPGCDAPGGV